MWFLAALGIATLAMAFGLTGAAESKKRSDGKDRDENEAEQAGQAEKAGEPISPVEATLRDPWFSVPATSIFFLHFARDGLNQIEEEPESLMATVTLFMPVAVLVGIGDLGGVSRPAEAAGGRGGGGCRGSGCYGGHRWAGGVASPPTRVMICCPSTSGG